MADGRFLSRSISTNEQLATVSLDAALLFTWCIPHLDVDGRLAGSAMSIKANVVPVRDEITIKRITKLIQELGAAADSSGTSLVVHYEVGRQQVLMFPGFARQQKLRRDREGASKLPPLSPNARILAGSISRGTPGASPGPTPGATPGATPGERGQGEGEGKGEVQGEGTAPGATPPPRRRELAERLLSDADRHALDAVLARAPVPGAWINEMLAMVDGMPGHYRASPEQLGRALRDYAANGVANPGLDHFRAYVRRAAAPDRRSPLGNGRASEGDDLQARLKHLQLRIDARKQRTDGEDWWERTQAGARQNGAANHREVLEYAEKQLAMEDSASIGDR